MNVIHSQKCVCHFESILSISGQILAEKRTNNTVYLSWFDITHFYSLPKTYISLF